MKRFLAVFLMLAILLTGLAVSASAATTGWQKEGDYWYYYKADGTMVTSDWVQSSGKWYYLDEDGVMMQDQIFLDKDGKWYAADKNGAMIANGWFSEKGESEKWDGTPYTETWWYYAGANGELIRGWKLIGGKWYYFEELEDIEPYMFSNCYDGIKGKWYGFKGSGEMIVGWGQPWIDDPGNVYPDTDWVYGNADGSLAEGWKKIDGKWYFFWPDMPYMARNTVVQIKDGQYSYMDPTAPIYGFTKSGAMVENAWFRQTYEYLDGTVEYGPWFYFGKDGAAKKGWLQDKGKWYYLDAETGAMQTGLIEMTDGKIYYLDETTGAMVTGWKQIENNWFFFNDSGALAVKEWVKSGSAWYYLKEDGRMAKDEILTIDGKPYRFDANGVWVP